MKTGFRRTWRNHTGNQRCQPAEVRRPATLGEVVEAVRDAEGAGLTVRAVGSGHSWSDAALTTGILLLPEGLAGPLPLEPELLRKEVDASRLVRTGSGTRLCELNARLDGEGRALANMGGYDGQTIAGVLSTSTHGSGLRFGPLADMARSLELVCSGGRLLRVERANGPTDARAFARARPGWELVQDDDVFDAAVVGMGCMGVLYAVTLHVRDAFWLKEVRTMSTWEAERERLDARLAEEEHLELFVNPYANADGVHACIVTTRTEVPRPPHGHAQHKLERHPLIELLARLPFTAPVLRAILDLSPRATPRQLDKALAQLRDDEYTNRSYRVFNIGAANHIPAYSSEIGVPLGRHVEAVDRLLEVAAGRARAGRAYHSSPFSLRFVRGTSAFLSMMEGADTMMVELIMQTGTEGGYELLAAHEDALYQFGGRPHWGQVNTLTEPALRMLYPRLDRWLAVRDALDQTGVFSSPFTKRVGLTTVGYAHA